MVSPAVKVPAPVGRSPLHSALPCAGIVASWLGISRSVLGLGQPWRAFHRRWRLLMINVRPWRRTTVDPGLPFNDLSDVLTFIVSSSFSLLAPRRPFST